ncbi:unnamed protein product [Mytilus coruscus]|uniref:Endonuclease/exonuclease/phosphatase domain-containing protein n=1 Tax=Mytilus coruscus TaxID=42192 RepID=A0A6J8CTG4_MYTCO|nr:unnamed protein product [Mytilus coruscus]
MQNYKYEMNIVKDYVNNYSQFDPVIVAGDFNTSCRVTDLERTNVNKSIIFSDFILRNNIVPVNASRLCDTSSFTYIPTRTVLDYLLVSEELSGSFNPTTKPYWSDEVKQAHKAKRLARRKWINQGRPRGVNFPSYVEYKSAKNEFRNRQRFAYSAYMINTNREIDETAECDVRLFWRLIFGLKSRKTNQISEIRHHNRQCKYPEDISNAFADFYSDVYTPTENATFDSDFKAYVTELVDRTLESCATNNGLLPGGEINIYIKSKQRLETSSYKIHQVLTSCKTNM